MKQHSRPSLLRPLALRASGALLALVASCGGGGGGSELGLDVELEPAPARVGPVTATLRVAGPDGEALRGAAVRVEANMNHAGMVPVFADAREIEPGVYRADLEFTMAGDWYLEVTAETGGETARGTVQIPGVARAQEAGGG